MNIELDPHRPATVEDEYTTEWETTVTVPVLLNGQPSGEVWVTVGVLPQHRGTVRALNGTRVGLESTWWYGDAVDHWCPQTIIAALRPLDPDEVDAIMDRLMDIVAPVAFAAAGAE